MVVSITGDWGSTLVHICRPGVQWGPTRQASTRGAGRGVDSRAHESAEARASGKACLPGIGPMAAVFPPWSNTALRVALVATGVSAAGSILLLMAFVRSAWRRGEFHQLD